MDSTRRNQAFGEASSIRYVVPFGIATYTFFRNFRSPYSDRTTPSPSWTKYTSCRSPFRKKVSFGIDSVGLEIERVVRVPWTIDLRPRIASPSCGMRPVKMWYGWRASASGGKSGASEDLGDGVELRVGGRRDRPLLHDQDHRGVLRWP